MVNLPHIPVRHVRQVVRGDAAVSDR